MAAMFVVLVKVALASCTNKNDPVNRLSGVTPFALYSFTDGQDKLNPRVAKDLVGGLGDATLNAGGAYLATSIGLGVQNGVLGLPITFPPLVPSSIPAPFSIELWFTGQTPGTLISQSNFTANITSQTGKYDFIAYTALNPGYTALTVSTPSAPSIFVCPPDTVHHLVLVWTGTQLKSCFDTDSSNSCSSLPAGNPITWSRLHTLQLAPQFRSLNSWSGTILMMSLWNVDISSHAYELQSCGLPNSRPYTPTITTHVGGDVITIISLCAPNPGTSTSYYSPLAIPWPYNDPVVVGDSLCQDFDGDNVTYTITKLPTQPFVLFDVQTSPGVWEPVPLNVPLAAPGNVITLRYQPIYGMSSWRWDPSLGWQKNAYDTFEYQGSNPSASARSLSVVGTVSIIVDWAFHQPVAVYQPLLMYPGDVPKPVYMDSLSLDLSSASFPDQTTLIANWSKLTGSPRWGALSGTTTNAPIARGLLMYAVNISMAVQAAKLNPGQTVLAYDVFNYIPCYQDTTFTSNAPNGGHQSGIVLVCGQEANVTVSVMNFLQVGFGPVLVLEHALSAVTPSARNTDVLNPDFNIVINGLPIYGTLYLWDGTPAVVGSTITSTERFKYNNTGGYGKDDSFLFHIERLYGTDTMTSPVGVQRLQVLEQNLQPYIATPRLTSVKNPNLYKGAPSEFFQPFTFPQSASIDINIPLNDSNTAASQQEYSITLEIPGNIAVATVENLNTLNLGTLTGYLSPNNAAKSGFTCLLAVCQQALSLLRLTGTKYGSTTLHVTINDNSLLPAPPTGYFDGDTWQPSSNPTPVEYDIEIQVSVTTAPPSPAQGFSPIQKVGIYTAVGIFPACCLAMAVALCWRRQKQHKASKKKVELNYIVELEDDTKKPESKPAAVEL